MKKVFILLLALIFGLSIYSMDEFNTLNVEVPCKIKVFKTDEVRVRIIGNQTINYEIKDSILTINGESEDNFETLVLVYSPFEQKIVTNPNKFAIREKKY